MNEQEFKKAVEEIKCLCCLCIDLKASVLEHGVKAVDEYDGMVCGGVETIKWLREKVLHKPDTRNKTT